MVFIAMTEILKLDPKACVETIFGHSRWTEVLPTSLGSSNLGHNYYRKFSLSQKVKHSKTLAYNSLLQANRDPLEFLHGSENFPE